jgi:hypothetical protein
VEASLGCHRDEGKFVTFSNSMTFIAISIIAALLSKPTEGRRDSK